jgi:hypothetical protein
LIFQIFQIWNVKPTGLAGSGLLAMSLMSLERTPCDSTPMVECIPMKLPGYPIVTPLARFIWKESERSGIPLGRFAPFVFGLAIGRWPAKVKDRRQ